MADAKQPNILVIWGDDIGITNLSAYSDGLMGYRTPNIDRIADEGMRFTDSYGEQSCTAGRSSFITGQSVYRTGLSKVGMPGADVGLQAEDVTIAELLKPLGYATGQFGKNHLGDLNKFLPTVHGFDEFFGNLYHLNAEEEPETPNWPPAEDFPRFNELFRPRGVLHSWATEERRRHRGGALRARRAPADRGHGTADEEADGDDRRRGARARARLRRPPGRGRHAVLLLVQHDPHALPHPPEAGEHRAGGALAVALPRHDDRPRQGRRRAARQARRARPRGGHDRRLQHRQRAAHEHVARRRHDAVPQREEHELGRRVPRPRDGPLAGQDPRRATVSNEIVQHHDWLPTFLAAAGEPDIVEKLKAGHTIGDTTYKVHIDGYNLLPYLTGEVDESPRKGMVYFSDDGDVLALRFDNWKVVFMEQRVQGTMQIWAEPFVPLRVPKLYNLRMDPFERADVTSNTYYDWLVDEPLHRAGRDHARRGVPRRRSRSSRRARRPRASRSTRWSRSSRAALTSGQ